VLAWWHLRDWRRLGCLVRVCIATPRAGARTAAEAVLSPATGGAGNCAPATSRSCRVDACELALALRPRILRRHLHRSAPEN